MRFQYQSPVKEWADALGKSARAIRKAGGDAMRETATLARDLARADIAGAGFSKRWRDGMKFRMERNPPDAIAAADFFHTIPFASKFEEGGTIRGKPLLWLPVEGNLPAGTWTARKYAQTRGPLASVNRPGKAPFLVAKNVPKGQERKPLFVGVDAVTIRKRFHIADAIRRAADQLPSLYDKNLKVD